MARIPAAPPPRPMTMDPGAPAEVGGPFGLLGDQVGYENEIRQQALRSLLLKDAWKNDSGFMGRVVTHLLGTPGLPLTAPAALPAALLGSVPDIPYEKAPDYMMQYPGVGGDMMRLRTLPLAVRPNRENVRNPQLDFETGMLARGPQADRPDPWSAVRVKALNAMSSRDPYGFYSMFPQQLFRPGQDTLRDWRAEQLHGMMGGF